MFMYRASIVKEFIGQAKTGDMPAQDNLERAQGLIGFSFGLHFDNQGQLGHPGSVNTAIAGHIVNHEVLRTKDMTLQEELAIEVARLDPTLSDNINSLPTIKAPNKAYNTHELLMQSAPDFKANRVNSLAVVAFRHHLPRAAAQVRKAGFEVANPDMAGVGDFDPTLDQAWVHSKEAWIIRERLVISAFAVLNRI